MQAVPLKDPDTLRATYMFTPSASFRTVALALVVACAPAEDPGPAQVEQRPVPADVHSYARPDSARVTHVSLDMAPDFDAKRIRGTAALTVQRAPGVDTVVLDARGLTITRVAGAGGEQLGFVLGEPQGFLGSRLAVALPQADTSDPAAPGAARTDTVTIHYETAPDAAALQWLTPAQTAGGQLPFLFTQGQAILTRTWIPTQDSPGIRQTYSAVVRVPAGMRAVMSAESAGTESERDEQGRSVFRFNLRHPVPPYLFALAVGDIAFRAIGSSTGVYAEPSVVEKAADEFAEVDDMIAAAERLYGPYRWGRYDILVLPPSFPFGGMENPTLTFATPTIIAGDRSLVALVAHELAHSWSGNLVTNATWDDFWLNEGFTTYIEARIMEAVRGKDYADMLRQLGRQDLEETLATTDSADTRLRLDLEGRDPDDGVTNIAYEKGSAFLQAIESVVGRERLDAWLRSYFDRNAFKPMTTEWLLDDMRANLLREGEAERIRLEEWAYQPGIPSNVPPVQSRLLAAVDSQVARWNGGAPASDLPVAAWSTHEWLHFLRALPDTIAAGRLAEMDRQFRLSQSGNAEILQTWLVLAIRNRYEAAFPALDRFLTSQGRRKFLTPLYTELMKTEWGRAMARDIYRRARPTYHSVATGTIDELLQWGTR
ncbi:MAG TPA: M1 family metallopeptidase [Gemmatimonadaceae bacterium]